MSVKKMVKETIKLYKSGKKRKKEMDAEARNARFKEKKIKEIAKRVKPKGK